MNVFRVCVRRPVAPRCGRRESPPFCLPARKTQDAFRGFPLTSSAFSLSSSSFRGFLFSTCSRPLTAASFNSPCLSPVSRISDCCSTCSDILEDRQVVDNPRPAVSDGAFSSSKAKRSRLSSKDRFSRVRRSIQTCGVALLGSNGSPLLAAAPCAAFRSFPCVPSASSEGITLRCLRADSGYGVYVPVRQFSSFLEASTREYLVRRRCLYAGDQEATEENRESESLASTRTSTSAGKDKNSRGASEAGVPCLQAPADPSPSARPLLSFELYDTACHNAICRASECLGDSGNKLPPRYFGWVIDGAAYLLVGGLLAVVLAAQATVVERRIDMHIKTLALTSAMYGGIAFWGFEAGRFGPRQSPPAGARRYLLGLCCVGLSALPPILCEVFSPSVGYASLAIPILFHAITTPYLKRPPSSAFAALRRSAAKLKTASTVTRSPVAAEAASQPPSASCTRSASCLKSMPAPPSSPCAGPLSRAASVSVFEPPSVDLAEASSEPPNGGGFLPQWWGSTLSHKCLLGFSLFSAVLGIYSVRKIEGTAEASILRDASESQQPSSRAPAFWAFWRAAEQGRDERDDERRHTEDQLTLRRARERLNQLGSNEKPGEKYWGNK